jgi:predicted dehydrogenase
MSAPIRFGILGCGRITRRGLIPGIRRSPAARLEALASLRPGVAKTLAAEVGCPKAYGSYEEILDDPCVDAVYIPTTGESHCEWALRAAAVGKHVLCEKSLAASVDQARAMVDACQRAGVILQEAFMWRHHPRTKQAAALLATGEIGELRMVCAHFTFGIDPTDWRLDPTKGGGAVWDVGCYGVNASRLFAGREPNFVHGRARFWKSGVDMAMQIALTFPNGVLANIDCGFDCAYRCELELVCSRGTIVLPDAFLPPPRARLLVRRGTSPDATLETLLLPEANQYADQVTDFCASVAAGRLLEPAENGLANMIVLERALACARSA